jgi:hypothetical protein
LPIFINEALSNVYGDNVQKKVKEILKANRNSGFSTNQQIIAFIKDLYSDYNIYDNYLTFFDKGFTSPLSRTGIDVYNYVLTDSAYIDKNGATTLCSIRGAKTSLPSRAISGSTTPRLPSKTSIWR